MNLNEKTNNDTEEFKTKEDSLSQISEDLEQVEKQIITYFTNSSIRTGRDKIFAAVLSNFYLRKNLTQKELQELTGFSAGAISQALKQCIKMNFIVEEKRWRKPFLYKMEDIMKPFIKNFQDTIYLYFSHEEEFREIQEGIQKFSKEQIPKESYKQYESMNWYLDTFFMFLQVYKKIDEFLQEIPNL